MVQLLAVDIVEYLHLPRLRCQAHLPVAIHRSLRCRIRGEVLGRWLAMIMLINTSVEHIGLRIPRLPPVGRSNFNLIEIIVSIMVAL